MFSNFIFKNKNTTIKLLYSTRFLFLFFYFLKFDSFTIVQEKSFSIYVFKTDFFNQLKKK